MKRRKDSASPVKILSFGALSPTQNADLFWAEVWRAHRYRNQLVAIERGHRDAWRAAHGDHPEIAPLVRAVREAEEKIEVTLAALRDARIAEGRDRKATVEEEDAVRELRGPLKIAYAALTTGGAAVRRRVAAVVDADPRVITARAAFEPLRCLGPRSNDRARGKALRDAIVTAAVRDLAASGALEAADAALRLHLDAVEERVAACINRARHASDLQPGTYLLIDKAADAFRKDWSTQPQFKRWEHEGRLGVHFGGGLATSRLASSTFLQIVPIPEGYLLAPNMKGERKLFHAGKRHIRAGAHGQRDVGAGAMLARIRVDSDGRKPVWAEFPVILHRPIPVGVVKDAWILARRVGLRSEFRLQLVVDAEAHRPPAHPVGRGSVAIDVGWRRLPGGRIRAGYLVDDAGRSEAIYLPDGQDAPASRRNGLALAKRLATVDRIHGHRDDNFEVVKAALGTWLAARPDVPPWLVDWARHLPHWRAPGKLAALLAAWRAQRFEGDVEIVATVEAWAARDRHLLAYEAHQRDRTIAARKEAWRVLGAQVASRYARVVVEELDFRDFAEKPLPEDGLGADGKDQRRTMRLVAPREMISSIEAAVLASGGSFEERDPAYTTVKHYRCGGLLEGDPKKSLVLHCPACDEDVDQDENAARNLLAASGPVRGGEAGPLAPGKMAKRKGKGGGSLAHAYRDA